MEGTGDRAGGVSQEASAPCPPLVPVVKERRGRMWVETKPLKADPLLHVKGFL